MSTLLPAKHRSLRHVQYFFARNLPSRAPSGSSSTGIDCCSAYFTIQVLVSEETTPIVYVSEVQRRTQHPTWDPLPAELLSQYGTANRFIFSLYFCPDDPMLPKPDSDPLIFECIMHLGDVEMVARNVTMLHELHHLPVHVATGTHPLVVLLRCGDGVFFPRLVGMSASEETIPRQSPTVGLTRLLPKSTVPAPSVDEWDLIDLEAVRSLEQRAMHQQRLESLTVGDVKSLCIASQTLHTAKEFLLLQRDEIRERINMLVVERQAEAALTARRFASASVIASAKTEKNAKLDEIEQLKELIRSKEAAMAERRLRIAAQRSQAEELSKMGASTALREQKQGLAAIVAEKQSQLANKITTIFSISSTTNCIDGLRVPADGCIETPDHELAIGHVCHVLVVFCNVHEFKLPHPVILAANRCRIGERHGAPPDKWYPLFMPQRSGDRPLVRQGMELLRSNIISAAFAIHRQNQAEGLPLVLSLEKLITHR
jgi:hypothetical protein